MLSRIALRARGDADLHYHLCRSSAHWRDNVMRGVVPRACVIASSAAGDRSGGADADEDVRPLVAGTGYRVFVVARDRRCF